MVVVKCSYHGCTYQTDDLPSELLVPLLQIHALEHSQPQIPASQGPKLNRPTVDVGIDEETWNAFVRRWDTFKLGSNISDQAAPTQLFQCTSDALGDLLLKSDPSLTTRSTAEVLKSMRSLAVIPVARGVSRAELTKMSQSDEEPIRTFAARVRGKAETCAFITAAKCKCGEQVEADYTEEVIRDVILAGIADLDIRRDALSMPGIQDKSTNEVISIIESREMARNATPLSSIAAVSSYKQARLPRPPAAPAQKVIPSTKDSRSSNTQTVPCPVCTKPFLQFRERPNGTKNKVPYSLCLDCFRNNRKRAGNSERANFRALGMDSNNSDYHKLDNKLDYHESDYLLDHHGYECELSDSEPFSQISALGSSNKHPKVVIGVECASNSSVKTSLEAIADTRAMTNVWGLEDF